jgi:hypothetical protein
MPLNTGDTTDPSLPVSLAITVARYTSGVTVAPSGECVDSHPGG